MDEHADEQTDGRARWERRFAASRQRDADFTTLSGLAVDPVYGPADLAGNFRRAAGARQAGEPRPPRRPDPRRGLRPAGGVTLPSNAVQGSDITGAVFVVHGDTVERRAVRLGAAGGDTVTILSGLAAGERVAAGDFSQLKDGAKIRVEP